MLNWHDILAATSRKLLQDPELRLELPDAAAAESLGTVGAGSDTIALLEANLGSRLPTSYRDFLRTSNGLIRFDSLFGPLSAVTSIGWFRELDPEWMAVWTVESSGVTPELHAVYGEDQDCVRFRSEYLEQCLQVSSPLLEDGTHCGGVVLLNPAVRTIDGWGTGWKEGLRFEDALAAYCTGLGELQPGVLAGYCPTLAGPGVDTDAPRFQRIVFQSLDQLLQHRAETNQILLVACRSARG